MKVLLINPPVEKITEPIHDRPVFLNLGLATLFSFLVDKKDIRPYFLDCKFQRIDEKKLFKKIRKIEPDVIGISVKTVDASNVLKLSEKIRKRFPGIILVAGGAHPGAVKSQFLEESCFDKVFCGESEQTFFDFLMDLSLKRSTEDVIISKRHLQNIPIVRWDLLPKAKKYFVMSARGCPFRCVFCMRVLGERLRKRKADEIVEEIRLIKKKNPFAEIEFADETFTLDSSFSIEVLKKIKEKGLTFKSGITVSTRVDTLDKDTIKLLKKYGVKKIIVGIESGDKRVLKNSCKGIDLDEALVMCKEIRKNDIQLETNFIVGLPGEDIRSIINTALFASRTRSDNISVSIAVPYPGTKLYDMAKNGEYGYILRDVDWSEYNNELSGALESDKMGINTLRFSQLFIYVFSFLGMLRLTDFTKFCFKYHKEAISFLRNLWGQVL